MADTGVARHYGRSGIFEAIRDQLEAAGRRPDQLGRDDLAGVDEFHLGGRLATEALLDDLGLDPSVRVLDVGCGIGGAARAIADRVGASVHGVDLTPEFVDTAQRLSAVAGLDHRTSFAVGTALDLPFDDDRFDVVTMLHVGMNIADKAALAHELARVLRPGGRAAIYDVMRTSDGAITYPVPWAADDRTSFVATPAAYLAALVGAGFEPSEPENRRSLVARAIEHAQRHRPPVDLSHLMGSEWPVMFGNLGAAMAGGIVAPVQIVGVLTAGG